MLQHGSYTLLIDACYDREHFPTLEEAYEWTWASTTEEKEAVAFVLHKFFTVEDGVYVQKRIQEEVNEYHLKAETNKRIAQERETSRRQNSTNRERVVNETPPNHKPLTKNHKPSIDRGSRLQADWKPNAEEIQYCKQTRPDLDPSRVAEDFLDYWTAIPGAKGVKLDWSATWRGWVRKQFSPGKPQAQEVREWHETSAGIDAKAKELGLPLRAMDEQFPAYKVRVMRAFKGESSGFKTVGDLYAMAQARNRA